MLTDAQVRCIFSSRHNNNNNILWHTEGNMRKGSCVTFSRINQEIPSVKIIVFLTSMIGKAEENKKIESRNSIKVEGIKN